jgi:acetyl esterase/lipase
MQVFSFDLNETKTAKLIVTVSNVPPIFQTTPALIHVPGGGFMFCSESDTTAIASRCMGKGFGVTCTYLYPVAKDYRFPQVVVDLMKGIKIIRDHAKEWGVNPGQVVISGNSAGAFICMTTGNLWNRPDIMAAAGCTGEEGKPNAMILGFGPMFCGQQTDDGTVYIPNGELVGPQTPPAFFHHARLDTLVSVYQTIAMLDAMERAKRPFAVYISSTGGHGETGVVSRILADDGTVGPCIDDWFEQAWRFLCNQLGISQIPQKMLPMMPPMPPAPDGEAPAMPPMMMFMPVVPEGSVPVRPEEMPLGQAEHIHMPFNAGFHDKDYTVYK